MERNVDPREFAQAVFDALCASEAAERDEELRDLDRQVIRLEAALQRT